MKRANHPIWLAMVVVALVGFIGACNHTQPGAEVRNAESKDPAETVQPNTGSAPVAVDNLPQPDPEFKGKIGKTYHDA